METIGGQKGLFLGFFKINFSYMAMALSILPCSLSIWARFSVTRSSGKLSLLIERSSICSILGVSLLTLMLGSARINASMMFTCSCLVGLSLSRAFFFHHRFLMMKFFYPLTFVERLFFSGCLAMILQCHLLVGLTRRVVGCLHWI